MYKIVHIFTWITVTVNGDTGEHMRTYRHGDRPCVLG